MTLFSSKRPLLHFFTASILSLLILMSASSFVLAQPPPPPQIFYGRVTIMGNPSGVGATVIAKVSNIQLGSATTDAQSLYTFSASSDETLAAGSTIDFYVNGVKAAETATYNPGAVMTEVNLTTNSAGTTPLTIVTSSLSGSTGGTSYLQTLQASGGTSPYTWSVVAGSGSLPLGLSLSSSGVISGTPTAAGTYSFTLQVNDSASQSSSATYSVTCSAAVATPLSITSYSLAGGTVGVSYSESLAASGGTAPYSWALFSGSLPPGLSLGSNGVVSGIPGNASVYTFTVGITDSASQSSSTTLSITILSASSAPTAPPPAAPPPSTPPASSPASTPSTTSTTSSSGTGQASTTPASASAFSISNLAANVSSTTAGNLVNISVSVANNGKAQGSKTLVVKINDEGVAQEDVVLEPGESKVVSFTVTKNTPGTYKVGVEALSTSFDVQAADTSSSTQQYPPLSPTIVVIIFGCGILAILVLLVLIIRKYRS